VDAYRKFALDVAQRVAQAHKEGGQPVSDAERAAIERVEKSLYPSGSE
jgi:(2Fe-2S) ferredoxin